jgi:hypothetical protein
MNDHPRRRVRRAEGQELTETVESEVRIHEGIQTREQPLGVSPGLEPTTSPEVSVERKQEAEPGTAVHRHQRVEVEAQRSRGGRARPTGEWSIQSRRT